MRKSLNIVMVASWSVLAACGDSAGSSASASASGGSASRGSDSDDTMTLTEDGASASESATRGTEGGGSNSDSHATQTDSQGCSLSEGTSESVGGASATTTATTGDSGITGDSGTTGDSSTTGQVSASEGTTGVGTTGIGTTGEESGSSTGVESDSGGMEEPCVEGGGGEPFSFLWIANSNQGSVSKVNALTLKEEARYWTDPSQSAAVNPSRTSVNIEGRFVVVSNRLHDTITKIAANKSDCVDKNGNGVIDTSPDKDTLLDYDDEECIIWTTKLNAAYLGGSGGPRATAFGLPKYDPKTCQYTDEKVWVGYLTGSVQPELARLDSYTGQIEATVKLPNWPLSGNVDGMAPYGAAVDPQGNIWITPLWSKALYRVHPETLAVDFWESPNFDNHYGIAVDSESRVWFANWGAVGISFFDSVTETWGVVPGTAGTRFRSVTADKSGNVWVTGNNPGGLGCGLAQVDAQAGTMTKYHKYPMCAVFLGVGVDAKGMVWTVDFYGWLYKMDPETYEQTLVEVPNEHYTYSDFTGSGLAGIKGG